MNSKFLFILSNAFSGLEIFNDLLKEELIFNGNIHPINYVNHEITIEQLLILKQDLISEDKFKYKGTILLPHLLQAIDHHFNNLYDFLDIKSDDCEFIIYSRKEIEEQIMSIAFAKHFFIWDFYFNYTLGIDTLLKNDIWMQNYEKIEKDLFLSYKVIDDFIKKSSTVPIVIDFETVLENKTNNFFYNYFDITSEKIPLSYVNNYFSIKENFQLHMPRLINQKLNNAGVYLMDHENVSSK